MMIPLWKIRREVGRIERQLSGVWRRSRLRRQDAGPAIPSAARVYVGLPDDAPAGFICCCRRRGSALRLGCEPWELHLYGRDLAEVRGASSLATLRDEVLERVLRSWFDALAVGGLVQFQLPTSGDGGLRRKLESLLDKTGFSQAAVDTAGRMLGATKLVNRGERQVAPRLDLIRADHRARYDFAARFVQPGMRILDVACGIGYGAKMLAASAAREIVAADISDGAISYAKQHYADGKIQFQLADALKANWQDGSFDMAVSFETVEHLPEVPAFLQRVHRALQPDGVFICSTPNESVIPFDPDEFPYHVRHFTGDELTSLLVEHNFDVVGQFTQCDKNSEQIEEGWHGRYNLAVCRRA